MKVFLLPSLIITIIGSVGGWVDRSSVGRWVGELEVGGRLVGGQWVGVLVD